MAMSGLSGVRDSGGMLAEEVDEKDDEEDKAQARVAEGGMAVVVASAGATDQED